jgi:pimeloyl-ACP methyl ester carboxylesterase
MNQKFGLLLTIVLSYSCSYLPEDYISGTSRIVDNPDYFLYYSGKEIPTKAFVMVPGGLVDPLVYECWIERLVKADTNIAVVVVRYPSNLAITNPKRIIRVMEEFDQIEQWIIGGHSLGGVVSASLVHKYNDLFKGIVLLASWPPSGSDLSAWSGCVLSIYASEDGLSTKEEIDDNAIYLPPSVEINLPEEVVGKGNTTYFYQISGGNHSGFGCYGLQRGDGEALISIGEQQDQVIEMMVSFFESVW